MRRGQLLPHSPLLLACDPQWQVTMTSETTPTVPRTTAFLIITHVNCNLLEVKQYKIHLSTPAKIEVDLNTMHFLVPIFNFQFIPRQITLLIIFLSCLKINSSYYQTLLMKDGDLPHGAVTTKRLL